MPGLEIWSLLLIALSLSADCFAVSIGAGMSMTRVNRLGVLRVALAFGIAQTAMCLLGWFAGSRVEDLISAYDHWAAFLLLAGIGAKMVWESFRTEKDEKEERDISRGWRLITMSIATSLDSLAVGLSFAFLAVNIGSASAVIGATSLVVTAIAFAIGARVGRLVGERAETVGGLVLIGIGVKILIEHLVE